MSNTQKPAARDYRRGPQLRRRGKTWYAFNLHAGHKGTSLQTGDAAEAQRRFRALLQAGPSADVRRAAATEETLAIISQEYLDAPHGYTRRTLQTQQQRIYAIGHWLEKSGIRYASEITPEVVDRYITARSQQVSRATINRDLRALRVCLRWAAERGLCSATQVLDRELREPRRRPPRYAPSPQEIQRAMEAVGEINRGALLTIACLYASGLRVDELRRLAETDLRADGLHVSPEAGAMTDAEPTKGYQQRCIALHSDARSIFREWFRWRAGRGGKGKRIGISDSWLRRLLHRAQESCGIPAFHLHDLRAAFASESRNAGIPLTTIQRWLGHADSATTEGYVRATRADVQVLAPVPMGVQIVADCQGQTGTITDNVTTKNPAKTAPPTRIELVTDGLGNRKRRAK